MYADQLERAYAAAYRAAQHDADEARRSASLHVQVTASQPQTSAPNYPVAVQFCHSLCCTL